MNLKLPVKFGLKLIPKIAKPIIVGTPVIIQNKKGEILLGKRGKIVMGYSGYWGLPGGLTIQGEKIKDSATREVFEEMGVKIKITKESKNFYEILPTKNNPLHSLNVVFYGKITKGIPKPKDETTEVRWFKSSEIKKINLAYNHKDILKKEGLI